MASGNGRYYKIKFIAFVSNCSEETSTIHLHNIEKIFSL